MKQDKSIKNLTALALKRPVTCFMLMISMIVAGLISSKLIPLDSWPAVNAPAVFVRASYPGSTPEEVERLITKPLEEALATMGGVNSVTSRTSSGSASLTLQMKFSTDLNVAILEAREKVDMVRHLLPEDLQRVDVMKFSTQDMPVVELTLLSELSKDFSGAEIEQVVIEAMRLGFSKGREFNNEDILTSIQKLVPLARTKNKELNLLKEWFESGNVISASK